MTTRATLRKGALTIPSAARKAVRLEDGDVVEVEVIDDEHILLRPKKLVDASQAWFWSTAWQAGEREADADLAAGRFTRFENDDALLAAFEERLKPLDAHS